MPASESAPLTEEPKPFRSCRSQVLVCARRQVMGICARIRVGLCLALDCMIGAKGDRWAMVMYSICRRIGVQ